MSIPHLVNEFVAFIVIFSIMYGLSQEPFPLHHPKLTASDQLPLI
ncbi:hypothetical protein ES703_49540 [subsurface metagenome]